MAGEWLQSSIGELCDEGLAELQTGPFGTQLHSYDYVDNGVPVVPTEAIRNRQVDHTLLPEISTSKAEELARHRLKPGDIMFARRGAQATGHIGYVREAEEGFICGTGAIRLRVNKDAKAISSDFLSHVLANPVSTAWFKFHAIGATMPNLNEGIIRSFPLRIPPLQEQSAIANILSTLDDKFELNRRMNATLEATTLALFNSWFVDFDPVHAKTEGRNLGLPKAIADLFPESFERSEIGKVPEGWRVEPFSKHLTVERGLSYKGEGLREDGSGIPMHNLNSIYEGGGYKHEGIKYYGGEYREKHLLKPGDMIVTNTEQGFDHLLIGHAAIVPECYGPKGIFSHHLYRVRHKPSSPLGPHYLVELFNNPRWHYWISGFSNGTTINMLPMDALKLPLLVVPPVELVNKFTALAEAVHLQIEANKQQSRTLSTIRDTLLPKLISGELRVKPSSSITEVAV